MLRQPSPTARNQGLLARWRAARQQQQRRTPPPNRDEWGMESALPWLQGARQ